MTIPDDTLAPIRNRGRFAVRRIDTMEGPMDVVTGETGPVFPFEQAAYPGDKGYELDIAELRALAAALNIALTADERIAALQKENADLRERVREAFRVGFSDGDSAHYASEFDASRGHGWRREHWDLACANALERFEHSPSDEGDKS